jgi:hypothetical protein
MYRAEYRPAAGVHDRNDDLRSAGRIEYDPVDREPAAGHFHEFADACVLHWHSVLREAATVGTGVRHAGEANRL